MNNAATEARVKGLKGVFERITSKREKKVIDSLVMEYRNKELTSSKAYAAIVAIAELRQAKNDITTEDLQ